MSTGSPKSSGLEATEAPTVASAETDHSFGNEERVRLMGQGLLNGWGTVLLRMIGFFLVPVMLHGLGTEMYGLWLIATTVANTIGGAADLGVQVTVTPEVAAVGECPTPSADAPRFVTATANLYLSLAVARALPAL